MSKNFTQRYCPDCENSYTNIEAHYRTNKHYRNALACVRAHSPPLECSICNLVPPRTEWVKCNRCVHTWCTECNHQMGRCPYCRYASYSNVELVRLFADMERWRRRTTDYIRHHPDFAVNVRLSWNEVSTIAQLLQQHQHTTYN